MLRRFAQAVHHHLSQHSRWEHAGLHGALITGAVWVFWWWPVDEDYFRALVDHPALRYLESGAVQTALALAAILACIGLVRRGWLDRACGLVALYRVQLDLGWYLGYDDGLLVALYHQTFHVVVERPFELALALGGDVQGAAALWVALYFGLIWIGVRLLARHTHARVRALLSRLVSRVTVFRNEEPALG